MRKHKDDSNLYDVFPGGGYCANGARQVWRVISRMSDTEVARVASGPSKPAGTSGR